MRLHFSINYSWVIPKYIVLYPLNAQHPGTLVCGSDMSVPSKVVNSMMQSGLGLLDMTLSMHNIVYMQLQWHRKGTATPISNREQGAARNHPPVRWCASLLCFGDSLPHLSSSTCPVWHVSVLHCFLSYPYCTINNIFSYTHTSMHTHS